MNGWNDYVMKQEQFRDQLRGAERHRLAKLVVDDCQEAAFGQAIRSLVSGMTRQRLSRGCVPCGECNHLLEKAA